MATENDDQHKSDSKVTIKFKIAKFSEFARQKANADQYSDPIFIRGIPWKILVQKKSGLPEHIGAYLCCMPEKPKNPAWSCEALFTLNVLQLEKRAENALAEIHHVFCGKSSKRGNPEYKRVEELLHPGNGWYNQPADTITIEAKVKAKIARGFKFDMARQWQRVAKNWLFVPGGNTICTVHFVDKLLRNSKEFIVHKNVLSLHSEVFRAMFANEDTKECVTIEDTTEQALQHVLYYMYSGKLPYDFNEGAELLKVADKYNIEPLAAHCEEQLMESLTIKNVCALLMLADRHNAHSLRIACSKMIRQNLEKVKEREEWEVLKESAPKLAIKVLEELTKEDFK